jgi:hypothetical protein
MFTLNYSLAQAPRAGLLFLNPHSFACLNNAASVSDGQQAIHFGIFSWQVREK